MNKLVRILMSKSVKRVLDPKGTTKLIIKMDALKIIKKSM